MNGPRHLFLLVEDWLLLSPRLIDLYSVAVSSTKLCVHTRIPLPIVACNICYPFAFVGTPTPQEMPGDMALPVLSSPSLSMWNIERDLNAFRGLCIYHHRSLR